MAKIPFAYFYNRQYAWRYAIIYTILMLLLNIALPCWAWTDSQIADAIYKAENSEKYPYGILTKYKHTTPRQACLNTIAHARKDFNGKGDFILFLAKRYAPVNCDNDNGTNQFWYKNVCYYLRKGVK